MRETHDHESAERYEHEYELDREQELERELFEEEINKLLIESASKPQDGDEKQTETKFEEQKDMEELTDKFLEVEKQNTEGNLDLLAILDGVGRSIQSGIENIGAGISDALENTGRAIQGKIEKTGDAISKLEDSQEKQPDPKESNLSPLLAERDQEQDSEDIEDILDDIFDDTKELSDQDLEPAGDDEDEEDQVEHHDDGQVTLLNSRLDAPKHDDANSKDNSNKTTDELQSKTTKNNHENEENPQDLSVEIHADSQELDHICEEEEVEEHSMEHQTDAQVLLLNPQIEIKKSFDSDKNSKSELAGSQDILPAEYLKAQGDQYLHHPNLGQFLKNLRTESNLTGVEFSTSLGIVKSTFYSIIKNERGLNLKKLIGLLDKPAFQNSNHLFQRIKTLTENILQERRVSELEPTQGFFSDEEDLRTQFMNEVRNSFPAIKIWDSRFDATNEKIEIDGFPFNPASGDIPYEIGNTIKSIELKFAHLHPKFQKRRGQYYLNLSRIDLHLTQIDLVKKGLMTLVIVGEHLDNPRPWGIKRGGKSKNETENNVQTLQKLFAADKIPYTYLIIDQSNWKQYRDYIMERATLTETKGSQNTIIKHYKPMSFNQLYKCAPISDRHRDIRSKILPHIAEHLFGIEGRAYKSLQPVSKEKNSVYHPVSGAMKKKISFDKPDFFTSEEEIRSELINTILENFKEVEVWDSRYDFSPGPFIEKGIPLVPKTGDILYRVNGQLKSIELKWAHFMSPKQSGNRFYRRITQPRIYLNQLELVKKGLVTLVIVGELVNEPRKWGIKARTGTGRSKTKTEVEHNVKKLHQFFGADKIPYSYLIIDKTNIQNYNDWWKSLSNKVINPKFICKTPGFRKMYYDYTPVNEQYSAYRSKLSMDIAWKFFNND